MEIYKPTFFIDDAANTARDAEYARTGNMASIPPAVFNSGMGSGGSNSPGIGINIDGGSILPLQDPTTGDNPERWSLLDQFGNARQAQIGQNLGGFPFVDRSSVDWPSSGGTEGTQPDATIRAVADSSNIPADGSLTLPAEGAWLADGATGWEEDPTP